MNWPREHPAARFCASAALRAAWRVIPLDKAIRWWIRGRFPSSLREALNMRFPFRPWLNLLRYKSERRSCKAAGSEQLMAAIGVKTEATLDGHRLQNRHN